MKFLVSLMALLCIATATVSFAQSAGNTSDSERNAAAARQSGCNPCYNGAGR
ncbi:hypothetical protein M2322_002703 [Rhodoblastus acidophilus]|nr:hypothetical protein [Rhodoblastus acidophilus]